VSPLDKGTLSRTTATITAGAGFATPEAIEDAGAVVARGQRRDLA
jgi:hypothetical protein